MVLESFTLGCLFSFIHICSPPHSPPLLLAKFLSYWLLTVTTLSLPGFAYVASTWDAVSSYSPYYLPNVF